MRRRLTKPAIPILAALLAVSGAALAGDPEAVEFGRGGPGAPGPEMRLDRLAERLDLTDDQKAAVQQVLEAHRDQATGRHEAMRDARMALHEAIAADTLDEAAIRDASAEVASLEADLAVDRARLRQELRSILTPEQFERWTTMRRRMERHAGHDGPGDRGHRPRHPRRP